MASSRQIVVTGTVFVLLLLASAPSMLEASRVAPWDRARAHAESTSSPNYGGIAAASPSQEQLRQVALGAPPMPPAPPAGKPESTEAKQWGMVQVMDGSVPSPGVGH